MPTDMERRSYNFDIEVRDDGEGKIVGHAAVFNEYTEIGWFEERVMPGAFSDTIGKDDIRALFNHDANYVLGRNKAGTLRLNEDERGLAIEILPPDTQFARDLLVSIKRGDISQMSFGFTMIEDHWTYAAKKKDKDGEKDKRDIIKVKLYDVSPVTFPAYTGTDVAVRSWQSQKPKGFTRLDRARMKLNLHKRR